MSAPVILNNKHRVILIGIGIILGFMVGTICAIAFVCSGGKP